MKDIIEFKSRIDKNFKTIDLTCIQDKRLSWKAKGLHTYMISRPDGWKIRRTDLINKSADGRDSVLSAINELKSYNYIYSVHKRDLLGKIVGSVYYILQQPVDDHEKLEKELNRGDEVMCKYVVLKNKIKVPKRSQNTENPDYGKSGIR